MAMAVSVREIQPQERQQWDALVNASPQGSVFLGYDLLQLWDQTNATAGLLRLGCFTAAGRLVGGQALIYKKALLFAFQYNLNLPYGSTPILSGDLGVDDPAPFEILSALARAAQKRFPSLQLEVHASLTDIRAYLAQGWEALPDYVYLWDLGDVDLLLKHMHRKSSYVRKAQKQYRFACEPREGVILDFLRLHEQNMDRHQWRPTAAWREAFFRRVQWLDEQDVLRIYTCRTPAGELVGAVLYVLSRLQCTAHFWMVGYDAQLNSKEFPPAIHFYAAQCLAPEFKTIDFGEGMRESLYAFKDSLGARSEPYWILATPTARYWKRVFAWVRRLRYAVPKLLRRA